MFPRRRLSRADCVPSHGLPVFASPLPQPDAGDLLVVGTLLQYLLGFVAGFRVP
jgi:hypothetical protein